MTADIKFFGTMREPVEQSKKSAQALYSFNVHGYYENTGCDYITHNTELTKKRKITKNAHSANIPFSHQKLIVMHP